MTFLLKFEQAGEANVVNVNGIEDALAFVTHADRPLDNPTLHYVPRQTYCTLLPGLSVDCVAQELDSQWEWAADDPLRINPTLKPKYQGCP